MGAISTIYNTLVNTPLPLLVEKLGLAVANAQLELDRNSVSMLQEMANTPVRVGDNDYNLLTLGFVPSFYTFTEATVEAKLEFSMTEATSFEIGGSVKVDYKAVAVSVNASYSRKFEQSASGSSSIAARLVSLPAPETFLQIIKENARVSAVKVAEVTVDGGNKVSKTGTLQLTVAVLPANAANKQVLWSIDPADAAKATVVNGLVTPLAASVVNDTVKVVATAQDDPQVRGSKTITIIT